MKLKINGVLFIVLLTIQVGYAQLSTTQQQLVKDKTTEYCRLLEHLATSPNDAETFLKIVDLFGDATNNMVYNDLIPGERKKPFMEYITMVRNLEGTVNFSYGTPQYYYTEQFGTFFGLAEVSKTISGGFGNTRTIKNVIVFNLSTKKIGELGHTLPANAIPMNQKIPVENNNNLKIENDNVEPITNNSLMSGEVLKDLPEIEMVFVEGGTFKMGSKHREKNEKPIHTVELDGFYMGKYEVTQAQWNTVMGTNPSSFSNCDDCPVEKVDWYDAIAFCNTLSQQQKLQPYYNIDKNKKDPDNISGPDDKKWLVTINPGANGYRLPTEAEWEYAARGGSKANNTQYAGSTNVEEVAWFSSNAEGKTHPVGQKKANELGIYDMSGNVYELCWGWYGYYSKKTQKNPQGPTSGYYRLNRGGSWNVYSEDTRVADRDYVIPVFRSSFIGFRLSRN